jgi:hypothetical protein
MKKLIPLVLIFSILVFFQIFIFKSENKKDLSSKELENCRQLNHDNQLLNKNENFSAINIHLKIDDERKWKEIILNTILSIEKDKSNTYDSKYTNALIIIKNKFGFECSLKAKIKPHGDLLDHFRKYKSGYDPIYALPSLKVKLIDGNIFGIVEFRLLLPDTRNAGNEIFVTTLFKKLNFYAPRTTYVNVNYNKKDFKFLFQEKINKEFLEINSLQEGLVFGGDERFVFKYETDDNINNDETGISKFRLLEKKFLENNEVFLRPAIEALQVLNVANHFYSSDTKQRYFIDLFTSQKKKIYENYFKELPEFDALMQAIGANHGLSRDDRRFYFDIVNNKFIPIYYDGGVNILYNDKFDKPNLFSDIKLQLKNNNKFLNSSHVGASKVLIRLKNFDIINFKETLNSRGLEMTLDELKLTLKLIENNLVLLTNLSDKELFSVSSINEYPIKNLLASSKNINAKYIFIDQNKYKVCDLLLKECNFIVLDKLDLIKAINQKLTDKDGFQLIFLGNISYFTKSNFEDLKDIKNISLSENFQFDQINLKIFGDIDVKISKNEKKIYLERNSINSRALFFDSILNNWLIEFSDTFQKNENYISRSENGLSGCVNIYDSNIDNLKIKTDNTECEDAVNFVKVNGSIENLEIRNALFDGLDADFSNLEIKKINVNVAGNDCSDFSYGNYNVYFANLNSCGDKAISIGENSKFISNKVKLKNSIIGIATKDSSSAYFKNVDMLNMKTCVTAYKKKQEFNGGNLTVDNLSCETFKDIQVKDNYSEIFIKNLK